MDLRCYAHAVYCEFGTESLTEATGSAVVDSLCNRGMVPFRVEVGGQFEDISRAILDAETTTFASLVDDQNLASWKIQSVLIQGFSPQSHTTCLSLPLVAQQLLWRLCAVIKSIAGESGAIKFWQALHLAFGPPRCRWSSSARRAASASGRQKGGSAEQMLAAQQILVASAEGERLRGWRPSFYRFLFPFPFPGALPCA